MNQERKPWQPPAPVDGPPIQAQNIVAGPQTPSQLVISGDNGLTLATIGIDDEGLVHVSVDPEMATEAARAFFDALRLMFGKVGSRGLQGVAWAQGARAALEEICREEFDQEPSETWGAWIDQYNPYSERARTIDDVL